MENKINSRTRGRFGSAASVEVATPAVGAPLRVIFDDKPIPFIVLEATLFPFAMPEVNVGAKPDERSFVRTLDVWERESSRIRGRTGAIFVAALAEGCK